MSRLYRKTQAYNDVLERFVRRTPEQWLWLHKRWKAYRGDPRWILDSRPLRTWILAFGLVGLAACAGTRVAKPTGIEVPPDAKVAIPTFSSEPEAEEEEEAELAANAVQAKTEAPAIAKKPAQVVKPVVRAPKPPKTEGYKVVDAERIPFELGERMEIDLNWMAIPAGRASIEVLNGPAFQDRPTFLLRGNVLSSKVVDAIYHVDNTIESYVDKTGLIPYKFLLHMVETHQKKETRVSFDQVQRKAHYWAQRISQKWGDELNDRVDDMKPSSQDMFSALYFARTLNYRMGVKRTIAVFENRQNLDVELVPVGNEFVRTPAGYFQCWKLAVTVKINNILKPNGDIFLWLSDDSKRYIVKFDAKLKVGSLIGTLVQVKPRGG